MKTLAKKLPVLIITICSLFAINSCASAPTAQENLPLVKEEQKAEAQKTDSTSAGDDVDSEDSQNKNEEENSVQIEKINEDEILDNETESAVSSTDFTEPEVLDALIEEPLEEAEKENADSINENSETENILPEQEEQTEDEAELTQTENSSLESEEPAIKAEAEPAQVEENKQQTLAEENNSTEAETFATVDAENTQLPEENLTDSATTGESDNSAETENAQTKESESLQNDIVVPSRTMTVKNAQYVDVVYPGRGWIYIGEEGENEDKLFRYFGRKLGSEDTTFTVRSIKSGKTLLHFYKNDVLTGSYIDDYLEIQVTDENASANERITAPSYAEVVPKKVSTAPTEQATQKTQKQSAPAKGEENSINDQKETPPQAEKTANSTDEEIKATNGLTAVAETRTQNNIQNIQPQNTEPKTEVKTADTKNSKTSKKNNSSSSLLEQAKESLKNKDYENALEEIQEYLDTQNTKIDEALYVQGQILEADSNVRNIKSAIDSYDSLIKHYPASKFWQDANKRKIYLKRYYISIY